MRAAILVNFVPPQRVSFFRALGERFEATRFLVSTNMEPNRKWTVDTSSLQVTRQRTLTIPGRWRHPLGSGGEAYIHVPYRTITELEAFAPDVVISAELGVRTALAAWYCRTRGIPLVVWVDVAESTELGRGPARRWLRRVLLRTESAVAVNGSSGARYVKRFGVDGQQIVTVPLPLEAPYLNLTSPLPQRGGCRRLLYAGRLLGIKGLTQFLRTLAHCVASSPRNPVQMTFVGAGPESEALRKLEATPNLRVVLQGEVPYDQMPAVYSEHDVLVLPTYGDTWGQVVAEGMACGLPVLGSRRSQAVEELVEDGVTGWLFDPVSPSSMESATRRALAADVRTLRSMGEAAQLTIRKQTPDRSAEAMMEAVANAVETRRASTIRSLRPRPRARSGYIPSNADSDRT